MKEKEKMSMKKVFVKLIAAVTAAVAVFSFASCAGGNSSGNNSSNENEKLQRYFAPYVKVSKSGIATWTDLEGAESFVYRINGGKEVTTKEKSVQLKLNDKIEVKCVGNGTTRRSSRWSDSATYSPARSYACDSSNNMLATFNVYKPDGTVVLDTISGSKPNGDILQENQEYIFEFDITVGAYHNALLLAGIENAVLSDLTWSDKTYGERAGESADLNDKFYEVLYNTKYIINPELPTMHRIDWSYAGEYFKDENGVGQVTYGWNMKSTPAANTNGVYDTSADGFWTIEPNWCSTIYGAHWLSSKKTTKEQMAAGYKYVRFKIKYSKFSPLSAGCVAPGEQYDSMGGQERFNMFAMLHNTAHYIYFNSDSKPEYEARTTSYATNDNGESATDVTVYDAETGNKIFGNGEQGSTLSTNKKYILEFAVAGDGDGRVVMTGIENALISNVTWSDKTYENRSGESTVADTLCVLGLDSASHHLESEHPLFHRLWKSGNGYTGNYLANCILNTDGEIDTSVGANRHTDFNRCLEFALKNWLASGKTPQETGKKYFRMTVEWRSFDIIEVGHPVEDKTSGKYGTLAGTYFNTFVYSPAGGRYLYLTAYAPQ